MSIEQLSIYSQTAAAAYASGLLPNSNIVGQLMAADVGMSTSQATQFNSTWAVLQQSTSIVGFSAVLLQRKDTAGNATGEKVLAIAGTDPSSPLDLLTDFVNVAAYGTVVGMPQYASLESFYAQLVSSGKLGASAAITVTGHSLGGFLAQAFTTRHSSVVSAAYTYNAPGFGSLELLQGFLGLTDFVGAIPKINNVYATDGISVTAGLGTLLGASVSVNIEAAALAINNHSVVRLGDSLAVQAMLARLDPNTSLNTINALVKAASPTQDNTLEALLDGVRCLLIGPSTGSTTTDDRNALYANLKLLTDSDAFTALAGKVRIDPSSKDLAANARNNFSALASLATLSPVLLSATNAANQSVLDGKLKAVWGQMYDDWQTDKGLSAAEHAAGKATFTDAWIADRAAMVDWMVLANTRDLAGVITRGNSGRAIPGSLNYQDLASGKQLLVGVDTPSQRGQILFGSAGADGLNVQEVGDHLYGGAGNDTLNGQGGADYLEGDAGADSLLGGTGTDTLVGGSGNDTLSGGVGNYSLLGGVGDDSYVIAAGDGLDSVRDADGQGSVRLAGAVLTGGQLVSMGYYQSADKNMSYVVTGDMASSAGASVLVSSAGAQVLLEGFHNGDLGVTLGAGQAAGVVPAKTAADDYEYSVTGSGADGLAGNDALVSLSLAQQFNGGSGDDIVLGGDGNDTLDGGVGNDVVNGGAGRDLIFGGAGNDLIVGTRNYDDIGVGATAMNAQRWAALAPTWEWNWAPGTSAGARLAYIGSNNDVGSAWQVTASDANFGFVSASTSATQDISQSDTVFGGDGNDFVIGTDGADYLSGDAGDDVLLGEYGADFLFGAEGSDELAGGGDMDIVDGGAGNDKVMGGYESDTLYGGFGDDQLWGDIPVASNGALPPSAALTRMGADYLDGEDGNDTLYGGGAADTLFGGTGNDELQGDGPGNANAYAGSDYLDGEAGNDTLFGDGAGDTLLGGDGNDKLFGDGNDSGLETATDGADLLDGGAGNDSLAGGGGGDTLYGGEGSDLLLGGGGSDWLDAGSGDDALQAGAGDDILFGGIGDDALSGGDGEDTLDGGAGNDVLDGGKGKDVYLLRPM
jgi:Ca2+-binding RTX toxin-like protein